MKVGLGPETPQSRTEHLSVLDRHPLGPSPPIFLFIVQIKQGK